MYDTKKYAKTYRQKHKEEIKAYAKAYRQKHKEEIKAYKKAWWEKNKHYYKYQRKDSNDRTYNKHFLFSVWNNITDEVVIIDGNNVDCAKAMGISEKSFYPLVTRVKRGKVQKWTIEKRKIKRG